MRFLKVKSVLASAHTPWFSFGEANSFAISGRFSMSQGAVRTPVVIYEEKRDIVL